MVEACKGEKNFCKLVADIYLISFVGLILLLFNSLALKMLTRSTGFILILQGRYFKDISNRQDILLGFSFFKEGT